MNRSLQLSVISILFSVLVMAPAKSQSEIPTLLLNAAASPDTEPQTSSADDESAYVHEGHGENDHGANSNHIGVFLGESTHLKNNDTAFTVGGHYGRRLSTGWTLGAAAEFLSSTVERDVIVVVTASSYWPTGRSTPGRSFTVFRLETTPGSRNVVVCEVILTT